MEIRVRHRSDGVASPSVQTIAVTMRTPGHDFELAAGFLFTEGIIRGRESITEITYCTSGDSVQQYNVVEVRLASDVRIDVDRLTRHFYATSSCGICGKASLDAIEVLGCEILSGDDPQVSGDLLRSIPDRLREHQSVFQSTGGCHGAALFDVEGTCAGAAEDVGRHNAVDKVVGRALLSEGGLGQGRILAISGRGSFEIMQKAVMARIPIVVAVGAPSTLAVEFAQRFGVTLVGFAGPAGYNVYSGPERIDAGP